MFLWMLYWPVNTNKNQNKPTYVFTAIVFTMSCLTFVIHIQLFLIQHKLLKPPGWYTLLKHAGLVHKTKHCMMVQIYSIRMVQV